jgi:uncharacterized protein YprB with RNaseH-like and TPR domain
MDLRAKLARLRTMEPPAALFEPPPSAAIEAQEPARDRTGLRAKLARLRSMEPPAALFEPPSARVEAQELSAPSGFVLNKGERIAQLRSMIAEISARESRRAPPSPPQTEAKPPPWVQETTAHGPLHVCARYLEPGHHHGHAPVRSALSALPATLPSLVCDADFADIDLRRALYLDTETTGLAGGTGTVAFLVGLARFDDESLCLEQLVVPQLGSETPMLARLAQRIAAASCIVTYNGKSFDWPLLRTRFVLARLPVPALPPHVDLLHVCRRLWKKRLASVRLVDMEREVLRFEREDDLPGSEIPARYFEFLRGGSPERLAPVLEHNQNDIIALPALLGSLLQQYEGDRSLCTAGDALYFGKLALRARDCGRARCFGEQALAHSTCPREARAALTLCAEIEHKLGSIAVAIDFLERAAALETPDCDPVDELAKAQLHFTLAKLYEHAQHDLACALRHARNTELVEGPVLHGRRLGRLYRRLLRSPSRPSP